ncbi:MAG: OsmC family protein [Myxococcales bacterium]|nr:OsmC family protein [Myxococcales bacterium]
MKARAKLVDGVAFMVHADSGHGIVVDGSEAIGGRNLGPRPMELVLQGLATCSAMDVISMLRKGREDVTDLTIDVQAERAEDFPKVFTKIHVHYEVEGRGLRERYVQRAVNLSMEKYCSVTKMLEHTATITHDFHITDLAAEAAGDAAEQG